MFIISKNRPSERILSGRYLMSVKAGCFMNRAVDRRCDKRQQHSQCRVFYHKPSHKAPSRAVAHRCMNPQLQRKIHIGGADDIHNGRSDKRSNQKTDFTWLNFAF